jgi:3',5'-cyclic AMP phosphodiesterase CpdA
LIALDTTLPTPPLCCHGSFSVDLEEELEKLLLSIPKEEHIILANHFPISANGKGKALKREPALLALFRRHQNIRVYLHGHTHKQTIYDGRKEGLPIFVDAGSVVHKTQGGWHLIECEKNSCTIVPFQWQKNHWAALPPKTFSWSFT